MALYEMPRSVAGATPLLGRLPALLINAVAAVVAWNDARVTRDALADLSDHELDDIGLIRGDIDTIAVGGLRR